jgi:hypothetical protein
MLSRIHNSCSVFPIFAMRDILRTTHILQICFLRSPQRLFVIVPAACLNCRMTLSTIIALLQAALLLLTTAQGPNIPQSLHDQAVQLAAQAITLATGSLSSPSVTAPTTAPQPIITSTSPQCQFAPQPSTSCAGTWSAVTNSNGCTAAWQCSISLPQTQSCAFNNQSIASGSSVLAYQYANVSFGQSCQSQTRTCSNGTLSGNYSQASCSVQQSAACTLVNVVCLQGYATIPQGKDANGCQLPSICENRTRPQPQLSPHLRSPALRRLPSSSAIRSLPKVTTITRLISEMGIQDKCPRRSAMIF